MAEKKAKAPLIRPAPAKEAPPTKGAPVAGTKPKSKSKPAANPPKFSDLIAMAQKVQTDPNALKTIKPTKPSTSKDNADISKPPQKGQTKPSKTIQKTAPLKANKDSSVASKKTNSQQSAKGNPPISDKGNPRKRPPQYRSCDQGPPVKQTLSGKPVVVRSIFALFSLSNGNNGLPILHSTCFYGCLLYEEVLRTSWVVHYLYLACQRRLRWGGGSELTILAILTRFYRLSYLGPLGLHYVYSYGC